MIATTGIIETEELTRHALEPVFYLSMLLLGAIGCFFGFRLFKLLVAVLGVFVGGLAGASIGYEFGSDPFLWAAGGLLLGGIAGAILSFFLFSLAVAFCGALFGVVLFLPWIGNLADPWWQLGMMFAAACLGALVSVYAVELVIRLGTAFIGAFCVVYGIAYFLGGPLIHRLWPDHEAVIQSMAANPWIAVTMLIVGFLGFFFQARKS